MLQVEHVNPDTRPDLFKVPVISEDGSVVYQDTVQYPDVQEGISLRKRCIGGFQDFHVYDDRIKLWFTDEVTGESTLCAVGQIFIEYLDWRDNKWHVKRFPDVQTQVSLLDESTIHVQLSDEQASMDIKITWKTGDSKQIYDLRMDGYRIRAGAFLQVLDDKARYSYDDFLPFGDVVESSWNSTRIIRFASEGVPNHLVVDPYLQVDETSTYIDVACDGFVLRFTTSAAPVSNILNIRNAANDTNWSNFHTRVTTSVDTYMLNQDENRVTTIHEKSASRVVISVSGNFDGDYTGTAYLTNSVGVTYWFYIYADMLFVRLEWETETAAIALTSDPDDNGQIRWLPDTLTSVDGIYGTSSETTGAAASTNRPSENYIGFTSSEFNLIGVCLDRSTGNEPTYQQRHDYPVEDLVWGWHDGNISPAVHSMSVLFIIDSAARDGSAKLYNEAARLAIGNQWKDLELGNTYQEPVFNDPANAVYRCVYPSGYTLTTAEQAKYPSGYRHTSLSAAITSASANDIIEIIGGDDTNNWNTTGADTGGINNTIALTIRALGTARHRGVWSTSAYRLTYGTHNDPVFDTTAIVTIDGIQIDHSVGGSSVPMCFRSNVGSTVKNCILDCSGGSSDAYDGFSIQITGGHAYVYNNVMYGARAYGFRNETNSAHNMYIINNTILDALRRGIEFGNSADQRTTYIYNNIVQNSSIDDYRISTWETNNTGGNISSDTSSPESALQSLSLTFEASGSDNYRLDPTDTEAIGTGTTRSETTTDIVNNDRTRHLAYDIGAFQYTNNPTVGLPVVDNRIPATLGRSGFAADGALHIEPAKAYADQVLFHWDASDANADQPSGKTGTQTNGSFVASGFDTEGSGYIQWAISSSDIFDRAVGAWFIDFTAQGAMSAGEFLGQIYDSSGNELRIRANSATELQVRFYHGGAYNTIATSAVTFTDTRVKLLIVWDGTNITVYADGTQIGTTTITGSWSGTGGGSVTLGADNGGSDVVDAIFHDSRIFDNATGNALYKESAKITFDRTRYGNVAIIESPSFLTGTPDAPVEHLARHYKLEAAYNTTQLKDEVSGSNFGGGADLVTFEDAPRGQGLVADSASDRAYIPGSQLYTDKLTINFDFMIEGSVPSQQYLCYWTNGGDYLFLFANYWTTSGPRAAFRYNYGTSVAAEVPNANSIQPDVWYNFHLAIDMDLGLMVIALNGKVYDVVYSSDITNWGTLAGNFYVGYADSTTPIHMRDFKLYNGCILPYGGGPFLSNDGSDYSKAHGDVIFHWDGTDCTSANVQVGSVQGTLGAGNTGGTTSFPTSGGLNDGPYFDNEVGANANYLRFPWTRADVVSIGGWAMIPSWVAGDYLYSIADTSRASSMLITQSTTGMLSFRLYNSSGTMYAANTAGGVCPVGIPFHWRIEIDAANGGGRTYINGILVAEVTTFTGSMDTSQYLYIGAGYNGWNGIDAHYYSLTITDDPNTPDGWSMFGKPRLRLLREVA